MQFGYVCLWYIGDIAVMCSIISKLEANLKQKSECQYGSTPAISDSNSLSLF
jgi:hypothetical protein